MNKFFNLRRKSRRPILTTSIKAAEKHQNARRQEHPILSVVRVLSSLANVAVLLFLAQANCQTREQIRIQQIALEIQEQSAKRTDSSIVVLQESVFAQKEANDLQRTLNRLTQEHIGIDLAKFYDENKPEIILDKIDCKIIGDKMRIDINFHNSGKASIANVLLKCVIMDIQSQKPVQSETMNYPKIPPKQGQVYPINLDKNNYVSAYYFRWTWPATSKPDSSTFLRVIKINAASSTCNCYTI